MWVLPLWAEGTVLIQEQTPVLVFLVARLHSRSAHRDAVSMVSTESLYSASSTYPDTDALLLLQLLQITERSSAAMLLSVVY